MRGLAIVNADIVPVGPKPQGAQAVLVRDRRIALIGSNSDVMQQTDAQTDVLDLKGRALLPGFIDTHVHFASSGLAKIGAFVSECKSLRQVLELVARSATEGRSYVRAGGLDPTALVEKRMPTREELDKLVPDRPAYIVRRDGHSAVLNSKALEYVGLPDDMTGTDRDPMSGELTGLVRGIAWEKAGGDLSLLIDQDEWKKSMQLVAAEALKVGVTTVHALDSVWVADAVITHAELLPIKLIVYYQTTDIETVFSLGLPRIGGCLLVDGTFASHTAALNEPYSDDSSTRGLLYFSDEELFDFVERAHSAGLQISMHAIGERAIDQILRAYERAVELFPRIDHRHRIEHFCLPGPDDIRRAARLGVHLAVQPAFHHLWGGEGQLYWQRLGKDRHDRMSPLRQALEAGITVGAGSDSAVSPLNPMLGVHAAVNDHPCEHRLNVEQALRLFTLDAARLAFEENEKGSIAPGKAADFVVLEENPLRVPRQTIKDLPVVHTIVDGDVKYGGS